MLIEAANYYTYSNVGYVTGTINWLYVAPSATYGGYSFVRLSDVNGTAWNSVALGTNTQAGGLVAFPNADPQILATLLWAQQNGNTITIYLTNTKWNYYNIIDHVQWSN